MTADPPHDAGADAGTGTDRMARSRILEAPPEAVFAVLADPSEHQHTEPSDWVREAHDPAPITGVDQIFGMRMFHVGAGGEYRMDNRVIAFEPDRVIAWEPGQYDEDGRLGAGGWTWRYELDPVDDGTEVTLIYDWSAVPDRLRELFGLPPFGPEFLEDSLAALDSRVRQRTG